MDQRPGYAGLMSPFRPLWYRRSPPVDGAPLQYVQCKGCAPAGRAYWTEEVIALLRLLETRYDSDRQAPDFRLNLMFFACCMSTSTASLGIAPGYEAVPCGNCDLAKTILPESCSLEPWHDALLHGRQDLQERCE